MLYSNELLNNELKLRQLELSRVELHKVAEERVIVFPNKVRRLVVGVKAVSENTST